ncbi:transcription repressor NadR [Clostridium minihomine]|uniref:transcription repressor NadR n=1 Tax=Clostridium minihomine TaxID=2045012 RepID=UPI000C7845D1|nr:transcription repressor NadR [Clostridium minihomine]
MNSAERREKIRELLRQSQQPISASTIAQQFQVSRQIIVGDIALLRASNEKIAATPRGYVMESDTPAGKYQLIIACRHSGEEMEDELTLIVDNGGKILDVTVEHAVYGQLSGQLHIYSHYDVENFISRLKKSNSAPLSDLTDGIHLHTVAFDNRQDMERTLAALTEKGYLLEQR